MAEQGPQSVSSAHPSARPARGLPPPGHRTRAASALLAVLVQLFFLLIWLRDTGGVPRGRTGSAGAEAIQWLTLAGGSPGTIHPDARRTARAAPKKLPAPPAPPAPAWSIPLPTLQKPEAPKQPAPEPEPMSASDADDFRRQWAQLQDDLQHKALDDAQHHGLKQDLADTVRPLQRFGAAPPGPAEAERRPEAPRPKPGNDDSMFAGELCVSRGTGEDAPVLALPCLGDGYTTDYGWEARVHAPRRGDPMSLAIDPGGRVAVHEHRFTAETQAALENARTELYKIGVTVRLVYLPELKQPIQLLARDDRARAISAQVFTSEEELARYLNEWAGNVHRWTAYQGQGAAPR